MNRSLVAALTGGAGLAAILGAGILYQRLGAARDRRRIPPPGRQIATGDARLHLYSLGTGRPPVVFESGVAASSLNWLGVQRRVAGFTTAVAHDRAGLGWSDSAADIPTAGQCCERLRGLLAAAGCSPPYVLVGHSFGAYVLQVYAGRHHDEVAGMVLVDPITSEDWLILNGEKRRMLRGGALFARAGAVLAATGVVRFCLTRLAGGSAGTGRAVLNSFGSTASRVVTRLVGEVGKMPPEVWPAVRAHWSRPSSFLAMARHLDALPTSAAEVDAALRAAPPWTFPLVVMSSNASRGSLERHRALAARSTGGLHVIVGDAGHWIHLDAPSAVVDAITHVVDIARASRWTEGASVAPDDPRKNEERETKKQRNAKGESNPEA